MGIVVESCKRTIKCCDSDDEAGYKGINTNVIPSESEESVEEVVDNEESIKKKEEVPKDVNDIKIAANDLFMQRHQSPWEFYEELEELGVGNYGVVKKVRLIKNPDIIRAMKIIPEENIVQGKGSSLIDEIEILKNLEHPNIMKIYESYVYDHNYFIISELCDQGHLLSKMEKLGRMDQIVVKFLMDQILNAVAYLHSKNILHGDIKLENVLLYTASKRGGRRFTSINEDFNENEALREDINKNYGKKKFSKKGKNYIKDMMNYEIKLIDFGCSKYFVKENKKKIKLTGTNVANIYCSPEVIDNLYDEKSDEWACGVLMYILLCGVPPFYGETENEIFDKIKKCEYNFSNPAFKKVSKNCKDLIRKLLVPNKQYRIKACDALKHPFFTENFDANSAMTENKDLTMLKQFIHPIKYTSKFHEAIIAYLSVNYITVDEEDNLRRLFRYMDKGGKNAITKKAIKKCLKEINIKISNKKLQKVFDCADDNGSGFIEYQEFIRNACDIKNLLSETNLRNAFNAICGDKERMSGEDIKKFIFHDSNVQEETLKEYFDQFGMKYEDSISFEDFYYMIKKNKKLAYNKIKKKESKYAFKGVVIDEVDEEDDGDETNRENENDNNDNNMNDDLENDIEDDENDNDDEEDNEEEESINEEEKENNEEKDNNNENNIENEIINKNNIQKENNDEKEIINKNEKNNNNIENENKEENNLNKKKESEESNLDNKYNLDKKEKENKNEKLNTLEDTISSKKN